MKEQCEEKCPLLILFDFLRYQDCKYYNEKECVYGHGEISIPKEQIESEKKIP